jgi:2-C-methyl-D-erythritol 4-phosphate cytidylyltransferase
MPAAGEGRRLGIDVPKALADIAGRPMVSRALEPFGAVPGLIEVVVLVPAEARETFAHVLADGVANAESRVIVGGMTRQESVRRGVEALRSSAEVICVHDAARPLATTALISAVIAAACLGQAATAAARPVDSVRQDIHGGLATRSLDRSSLWLVQTPQAFSSDLLREAHRRAQARGLTATDDASLVEEVCGATVTVVPNDMPNLKVTTLADLACARALLS